MKPDMRMIWANSGDIVTPPESKIDLGWILEKPPSQYFNWHLNRTDRMLNHINQRGIPQWDDKTEYHTGGIASYVVGSNGRVYTSVAPSGTSANPAKDPTTDVTRERWKPAFVGWDEAIPEGQITGLTAKLNSKVDKTQSVNTSNGLAGGGALSGNLTLRPVYGTTANTVTQGNDSRLSNSREWTASTVSESEAKAGTATTRRAWTAQRVHQAADGWHDSKFSTLVKNILSRSNAGQIRNDLGLGSASLRDVGTSSGNVMEVGAFGLGNPVGSISPRYTDIDSIPQTGFYVLSGNAGQLYPVGNASSTLIQSSWDSGSTLKTQILHTLDNRVLVSATSANGHTGFKELTHTGNIRQATGNSTEYPMSQAATTAALNTKVDKDGNKGLSDNNFTTALKSKLEGIEAGATNNPSGSMGRTILTRNSANQVRNDLQLKSAALRDVGTSVGDVMEVGAFGLGSRAERRDDFGSNFPSGFYASAQQDNSLSDSFWVGFHANYSGGEALERGLTVYIDSFNNSNARLKFAHQFDGNWHKKTLLDAESLRASTGNSASYPMSQAAVTNALNTKVDKTSVVQSTGSSTTNVMSQKAVTDGLALKVDTSSVSTALAPNTIPQRDSGGRVQVAPPTADGHATNRAYVTTQIGNIEASVTDKMLGVGQSWVNVSLSENTYRTNSTGRPIMVVFTCEGAYFQYTVGGLTRTFGSGKTTNWGPIQVSIIVPDGESYRYVRGDTGAVQTSELR